MGTNMKLDAIRQSIIDHGVDMTRKQLTSGSWGNISVKIEDNLFAITPSGVHYERMFPEDIVLVDAAGNKVDGQLTPSSETHMHLAIYKANPNAKAIIHSHSTYASALAAMRRDLPPIIEDAVEVIGGPVVCARYAIPGTSVLAQNVVDALDGRQAAFIANHGAVSWGRDLDEAMMVSGLIERASRIYFITETLGGAVPLQPAQIKYLHDFYENHYFKRQRREE